MSAGRAYGLWLLDDGEQEPVHTWIDQKHHAVRIALHPAPEEGACCAFHCDIAVDDPTLASVGILHCLRQILGCRGDEAFFAALESALRQGMLDDASRERLKLTLPAASRWLVDFARSDADSGLESLVRLRLRTHGLALTPQVAVPGVGVVDFVIGDCLIVEADGDTHDGPSRHRDRVRDAVAMALGFVTLRFDYALIVHDWEAVEAAILAAVSRNLHRSPAGLTWRPRAVSARRGTQHPSPASVRMPKDG
ncbi:endonuclease domain-containing protein [Microbacterium sp. LWH3-1.2]|uniref:endonuclease domain-containing protein n=1 Tax=Microbacterium sp. LWH3-1.2 TaxID=3135256 RepID=UPI003428C653